MGQVANYTAPGKHAYTGDGEWCYGIGFSKFTSRKDIELILGNHKPIMIDPLLLLTNNYFSGCYGFCFQSSAEIRSFKASCFSRKDLKIYASSWVHTKRLVGASLQNVSACTLRLGVITNAVDPDQLAHFFETYGLRRDGIIRVNRGGASHYLLHFDSPEEAERALVEKNMDHCQGQEMHLMMYPC